MKHGNPHNYPDRCRCDECRIEYLDYHREVQRRARLRRGVAPDPRLYGVPVPIDPGALRRAIKSDGRPQRRLSLDAGLCDSYVAQVLRRKTARDVSLDKLACALGVHMSALERRTA